MAIKVVDPFHQATLKTRILVMLEDNAGLIQKPLGGQTAVRGLDEEKC
jgi:hypothetical protein